MNFSKPLPRKGLRKSATASNLPLNCVVEVKSIISDGVGSQGPWALVDAKVNDTKKAEKDDGAYFLPVTEENIKLFDTDANNIKGIKVTKFERKNKVWTPVS